MCDGFMAIMLPTRTARSCDLQARNAAVRAAAAVRALTGAFTPEAAEAAASASERTSPPRHGHAPGDAVSRSGFQDGIQPGLEAGTPADITGEAGQAVAMDVDAGSHGSSGMDNIPGQPSEQIRKSLAAVTTSAVADAAAGAGTASRAGAAALDPVGTVEESVQDAEPAPLLDGRPPERSWLPLRGTGAGRVDLYRVKKKL